jgi:sporulation protein YlmC with PRC-barrel domain
MGNPSEAERNLIDTTRSMLKRRVLTEHGVELDPLVDMEFDPETGNLEQLVLGDGTTLPADRLLGVGRYATVVSEPAG